MSERNLGRAQWHRSVGNAVFGRLADIYYEAIPKDLQSADLQECDRQADEYLFRADNNVAMARAFALSMAATRTMFTNQPFLISGIREQAVANTFSQNITVGFTEGVMTQATFPLNLAAAVSEAANQENVPNFSVQSLGEIAGVLRRPDYRELVDQAAFTKNGVWESFATSVLVPRSPFPGTARTYVGFEFSDENVAFDKPTSHYLKHALQEVNRRGLPAEGTDITRRASSGCPVRHLKPHFPDTTEGRDNLTLLAHQFNVSREELLAPRKQSVINDGLDILANLLEQAAVYYDPVGNA